MMSQNNEPASDDSTEPEPRASRPGLVLFAVYLAMYAAFVVVNTFAPSVMENDIFGVNLAVVSGMTLIIAAFVLAVAYAWLCRAPRSSDNKEQHP